MTETAMLKIIDGCSTSLIGSIDTDGFPNMKAMLPPRKRNGIKEFFFTTNTSSLRVAQFNENEKSCVYFFDSRNFIGIMIVGTMEVLQDETSKKEIWKTGDELYYPLGVNDPDYCVLKFSGFKIRTYHDFKKEEFNI